MNTPRHGFQTAREPAELLDELMSVPLDQPAASLARELARTGLDVDAAHDLLTQAAVEHDAFEGAFGHERRPVIERLDRAYRLLRDDTADVVGLLGLVVAGLTIAHEFDRRRGFARERLHDDEAGAAFAAAAVLFTDRRVLLALKEVYRPDPAPGRPPGREDGHDPGAVWDKIDFPELRLHRLGTTSFILSGPWTERYGRRATVALKCVLLPYTRIAAIARSTAAYADTYDSRRHPGAGQGRATRNAPHFPEVYASTAAWVAMELVEGRTLAEELAARFVEEGEHPPESRAVARLRGPDRLRLDLLADLGLPLFQALSDIQARGLVHNDLAPSNVIVTRDPQYGSASRVVLIDFGRNHLYTRTIGALEGPEADFIAPEAKKRSAPTDESLADLYSLGRLLIAIGGADPGHGQEVPDAFYVRTPVLARFVEDLIDLEPTRRLVLYGDAGWAYADLGSEFAMELRAVTHAEREGLLAAERQTVRGALDLVLPGARTPRRQWRLFLARRRQERELALSVDAVANRRTGVQDSSAGGEPASWERPGTGRPGWLPATPPGAPPGAGLAPDAVSVVVGSPSLESLHRLARRARRHRRRAAVLLFWSGLCTLCWAGAALLMSVQATRDLGLDPTPTLVQTAGRVGDLLGWPAATAALNDLQARIFGWLGPPGGQNLGARIVAGTFALVNVKLYQNILAGISPVYGARHLPLPRRAHAVAAEVLIRAFSFWWVIVVLAPQFGSPLRWPICVGIGLTMTFLLNSTVSSFAGTAITSARDGGMTTVPPASRDITGLRMFSRWTPSMFVFLLAVWPIAYYIWRGTLDDLPYAVMLSISNLGIFYLVKCGLDAAPIRIGLARAFLASEREAALRRISLGRAPVPSGAPRARPPSAGG